MGGKVALFLPSLRGGGAERVMLNLARGFAERGLGADLVLVKAEGPFLREVSNKVRVVDLNASRVIKSLQALVRYLRSEKPDVMLSAMRHANIVAVWARSLARVSTRVVISEHSNLIHSVQNAPSKRARFMPWLMGLFYPRANGIIAVSKGVADDLAGVIKLPCERITVIYNPVVTPELFEKAREPTNHPWFQSGEPPVILGVGRLTKPKDFSTLIEAFALVRQKRPARLMILGEGEERPKLQALVRRLGLEGEVGLPGFVENPYAFMRQAAIFVLSSQWEGLGNVLIEAMAVGTPVVATDCPNGPREIMEGARWGRLVPVGDATALAGAILETLRNPPDREALKKRAEDFAMDKIVKQYLALLYEYGRESSGNS